MLDEENTFAPDSTGAVTPLDVSAAELIYARLPGCQAASPNKAILG